MKVRIKILALESKRIKLIACDEPLIRTILEGDEQLSRTLHVAVPEQWTEFGTEMFSYTLNMIGTNPANTTWSAYLPVEKHLNVLLGTCGYKGAPDDRGAVEIGYEIARDYRNRGYATEVTQLLVDNAFSSADVNQVVAHTLPEENASVAVLRKCGFQFAGEVIDPNDGLVWKWVIIR